MPSTTPQALTEEIHAVRTDIGLWQRLDHTFVRITGPDAASWLHSQTTNDVEALATGMGHHNTVLDRKGRLQGHFTLHRWEDEFWMIIESAQADHVLKQLDDHLFIEDVQLEPTGDVLEQMVIQGPESLAFLASIMDSDDGIGSTNLPAKPWGVHPALLAGEELLTFRLSPTGEDGYLFLGEQGQASAVIETLLSADTKFQPKIISPEAREILRIEAGLPRFGIDMDTSNRLPETTLERTTVSYEKGCYIGQEVVARLKAYGTVKQALMGLVFESDVALPKSNFDISVDDKRIGRITSTCQSPTLNAPIALAYLDRDHRTPGETLTFTTEPDGPSLTATVQVLPLYEAPSRKDHAYTLYDRALDMFQQDLDDSDASAIPLLKEAILLQPEFEDAYEVLGVILHRHHRVDEAIHYMRHLAELNPDCLMAHTNLSVFYVAKGMIEEAEQEKALSAVIGMNQATSEREAKELAQQERQRIQQEAEERIGMFKEVLEIDPDDPVATFGMGKAYVQLADYEKAIPHLQHATEVQKDFSAAYLDLGKCYEFINNPDTAREAYTQGIAVASRKGDLMPMREMERRLKALDAEAAPTQS